MLEVKLMGEPEINVNSSPLDVDTRKAIAMLAYLAVEGPTSRERLTTLFWPDASPDRARATLRRTLSSLRSGVGNEHIDADRNRVELIGEVTVDVAGFDREVGETQTHNHDPGDVCSACIPHLARATDLYRGDFLQGFSLRDAFMFEDWARTMAEGLRLRAGEAFNRLGYARAGIGDYAGAIRAVTRWVEQDPLHEPAHRLLMLLHAWAGDRPGAVAAYRSFVGVLDRELGVPPLEETTELHEAILDEDLPPAPGMRHRVRHEKASQPIERGAMLDRHDELDELLTASRELGGGNLISIVGDSWMGKTRLIEEFATRARTEGTSVLLARAFRMEQALPYGVLTQILGPVVQVAKDQGPTPEWALSEVSRLSPRLTPGVPPPSDRFGEVRLFEAFRALLAQAAADRRTVVVVDDAQWADRASAALLAYLGRGLQETPVLLVVAVRSGEPLDAAVEELLAASSRSLHLRPLDEDALEGHVDDPAEAKAITAATGGVPLLMLEALAGRSEEDSPGVVRYMSSRMHDVSNLARQLLAAAALLTGVANAALLREVSGRTEEEVVEGVEELIAAGLIAELPESDGLRFTLDALETIVYDSTSLVRRRLLHRRAADALENLPWARSDPRLAGAIAAQHRGAGDPAAASWYRLGGDLARDVYAHDEAREFYEAAIALGADAGGSLHLALGEIAMARAEYEVAKRELRVAASHAAGETLAIVEQRLGEVQRILGRFDLALESFERSLVDHPRPADVYAERALLQHRIGDAEKATSDAFHSLELARSADDPAQLSRSLNIFALVSEDQAAAMGYLDEALDLAGDDDVARMSSLNNKAGLLARKGDLDDAIGAVEEAIEIAERTGHRHREAALRNHLADLYHQNGRDDDAARALTGAVALFADIDAGAWEPELWLLRQW